MPVVNPKSSGFKFPSKFKRYTISVRELAILNQGLFDILGEKRFDITMELLGRRLARELLREWNVRYQTKLPSNWEEVLGDLPEMINGTFNADSRIVRSLDDSADLIVEMCPLCDEASNFDVNICQLLIGFISVIVELAGYSEDEVSVSETECNAMIGHGYCTFVIRLIH
jgi:predicted hydrocarbon binding protein